MYSFSFVGGVYTSEIPPPPLHERMILADVIWGKDMKIEKKKNVIEK
jgi:hypothetical protein